MKMKTCLALALAAGCTGVSIANETPALAPMDRLGTITTDRIGHIYYNVKTGEMIQMAAPSNVRNTSSPKFVVDNVDQCGFNEQFFYGVRNVGTGVNDFWQDWGWVATNTVIDCFQIQYVTDVADPNETGVTGHNYDLSFFEPMNFGLSGQCGVDFEPWLIFTVEDLPGSAAGFAGWIVTLDFCDAGAPEFYFEVGDFDGVDQSGNGFNSGVGANVTQVAPPGFADLGYGVNMVIPLAAGLSGPSLALPTGDFGNTYGVDDAFGIFDGSFDCADFLGVFFFGGYDCTGGSGFNWNPWGSAALGLYGDCDNSGPECPDCTADWNGDTQVDFFDVLGFLGDFSSGAPCADLVADNAFDFFDILSFLGAFSAGCP